VGGGVVGIGELARQEHPGVGRRDALGLRDGAGHAALARHEGELTAVAADDHEPLVRHALG
jgi:hypothetical protein